ncbi:hypothetical protein Taro_043094 [Colocasia esculenta]|uniref:Cytochrome P450 71A1 n=1 Tax=Colocasia esculenta TaxID=4460 RepID=A0A843WY61_COLES|nr:hypothetical protein [Colocasia esculenta]
MAADGGLLLLLAFILLLSRMLLVLAKGSKQIREKMKHSTPPGPTGLPVIGNLHQLGSHQHRTLHELSKRYGPLMHLQLCSVPVLVVSSAELAEEILKKNDLKVSSRPSITPWRQLSYNFSDVGFSPYGATWRELRKITVVSLLNARKVEGFRYVREEEVERMIASISSLASLSKPINLSKLLHALSNSIVCRAAFGKRFHNAGEGYSETKFHGIFQETQALLSKFFVADYIPWAGWADVLTGLQARLKKNFAEIDAFCKEVIEAHINVHRASEDQEEDFVDVLLRLQKKDSTHLTMNHIKGLIMDIFIAATETSSATVEYAIAELIRNPSAMLRAQEEVRGMVGTKGKAEESDLSQLNYLKSIIKETFRLHPVAPLLIPRETLDTIDINGYSISPKTRVLVNAWAIGRDPKTWQEPDKFIPERFMDSTIDFKGHDFQLIPFGAGRRICPGITFGIMTVELALANLLYAFNWEDLKGMGGGGIDMDEGNGIAVRLKNDLQLKATKCKY